MNLKYSKYVNLSLVHQFVTIVSGLLIMILIMKNYTPSSYGRYIYLVSIASIIYVITNLGLSTLLLQKDTKYIGRSLKNFFFIQLLFLLLLLFTFVFVAPVLKLSKLEIFGITAFSSLSIVKLVESYYIKLGIHWIFLRKQISFIIFLLLLKSLLIYFKQPLEFLLLISLLEIVLVLSFLAPKCVMSLGYNVKEKFISVVETLKLAVPYLLSGIAIILYMRLDILFLEHLTSNYSVANYGLAARIIEITYFVPLVYLNYVHKANSSLGTKPLLPVMQKALLVNLISSLLILCLMYAALMVVVKLPIFKDYNLLNSIKNVMVFYIPLVFLNTTFSRFLVINGRGKLLLLINILGMLSNCVLNFYLINAFSTIGAAYATVCSMLLMLACMCCLALFTEKFAKDKIGEVI